MTPYYEHNGITVYHGDCAEVLDSIPKAGLVLTDPPYGIRKWTHTGGNSISEQEAADINNWDLLPSPELIRRVVAAGEVAVVWGGNYLCEPLGAFRTPLVWDKGIRGMHFADGELAWTNFDHGTLRILNLPMASSGVKGKRDHPTQKPEQVMGWCIDLSKTTGTILDPFMGSGTTLVAAKARGRSAIGIEINERYCEIAVRRLGQETLFKEE